MENLRSRESEKRMRERKRESKRESSGYCYYDDVRMTHALLNSINLGDYF